MSRTCLSKLLSSSSISTYLSQRRCGSLLLLAAFFLLCVPAPAYSQTKRVVTVQFDGLPFDVVDRFVRERDPRTGKSQLPWIDYIFYQRGTRLANFYVRGMSLSAPSWSLIDTGQHLQIKGNVEFDRYTLQTYDYLNFVPFYVNATAGKRIDMQGIEVLDSIGIPVLADAYAHNERHATFSLFQRSPRYVTFQMALMNKFKKNPRDLFDEWTTGFEIMNAVPEQLVREVVEGINDPRLRYLELVLTTFDHAAHHNNDRQSHLLALKEVDSILGEIWTAIQKSPLAPETTLIVVSDHGINSDERVYSQGYNLVKLLGSSAGGGHHVITKRRLLTDYALKGINPFVNVITTKSRDSYYLKGQSVDYPTALLDFDGNERASLHLRDSTLNLLQIILEQLQRPELSSALRTALTNEFFKAVDGRRLEWQRNLDQVNEEMGALHRGIEQQRELCAAQPKKFTKEESSAGLDDQSKRVCVWLDIWMGQETSYSGYARTLTNLLALRKETFNAFKLRIDDVIGKQAMGERNTIHQLQNYVVGIAPDGLHLNPDGSLNMDRSFIHLDYFSLLKNLTVNNNVQAGVDNHPVDLIAIRVPSELVTPLINENGIESDVVWVYEGPDRQALILSRIDQHGELHLRYLPVKNLTQDQNGRLHFESMPWRAGLPLQMLEDEQLRVPDQSREMWLSEWHTDLEWLRALHKTRYSNGLIGLHEELARHLMGRLSLDEAGISADERLRRRLLRRQRQNIEADMLVVASDHWNFDVRGFNPGGNHGSFLRISTHSTFMLAGGDQTGIPRAAIVEEPYDSLSFVPTVLALTGNLRDDNSPSPVLWDKGFRHFPGRPVREVLGKPQNKKIVVTGATASP
ncbi:MAG: alkaline phosphatase family protein [Acidobacteriota bacterium]|nr:alkaline phosphatase family protein [Acidobacteriota bacterium]